MSEKKEVTIWTDGACHGNPGAGGYGAILRYGQHAKELSGGFRLTTNNRMEMYAVIVALRALKRPCQVTLHSDSRYVVDSVEKGWARRWRAKNWYQKPSKRAANPDLWAILLDLCDAHEIRFVWVKGHAGIPDNERCDALAEAACREADLPIDEGYEAQAKLATTQEGGATSTTTPQETELADGNPCRKCGEPLVKKEPARRTFKPGQRYYFVYYFQCSACKTNYMVEDAKRDVPQQEGLFAEVE